MRKNKKINGDFIVSIIMIIALILVTMLISFVFFKEMDKKKPTNEVRLGQIKFLYTSNENINNGIILSNKNPVSDEVGKTTVDEIDFRVVATTEASRYLKYQVLAKKTDDSTMDESLVKLYLTEDGTPTYQTMTLDRILTYNLLQNTTIPNTKGKVLYEGIIHENQVSYAKRFILKMWLSNEVGVDPLTVQDKTFSVKLDIATLAQKVEDKYDEYKRSDAVTLLDGSKWHVIANSNEEDENVILLSDYNIDSNGNYILDCKVQKCNINYDANILNIVYKNKFRDKFIGKNLREFEVRNLTIGELKNILNIDKVEEGLNISNNTDSVKEWLLNNSFYLNDMKEANIWSLDVLNQVITTTNVVNNNYGIRPVIVINKNNILK